jgi:glycosyltransferase involved in cell wall biosynthesis
MKVLFYSPYIPKHIGGGEKYLLDCARIAARYHQVSVAIPTSEMLNHNSTEWAQEEKQIRTQYENFLGESLAAVRFIPSPLGTHQGWWAGYTFTRNFDVLYHLTDGSFFLTGARRNIVHFQFPFHHYSGGVVGQLKLRQYKVINSNSVFTKTILEKNWPVKISTVHYPMISVPAELEQPQRKQKVIVHVGRFFSHQHTKRQDILVDIFKKLYQTHRHVMADWKLVLIGTVEDEAYAAKVRAAAKDLPIEIYHTLSRSEVWQWYRRASIYWHATGYGVDELLEPEKVEHFGISTVEAMALGCVPVVINKGGQPEIVTGELAQLLWSTKEEAAEKTLQVIKQPELRKNLSELAVIKSQTYNEEIFEKRLLTMLGTQP